MPAQRRGNKKKKTVAASKSKEMTTKRNNVVIGFLVVVISGVAAQQLMSRMTTQLDQSSRRDLAYLETVRIVATYPHEKDAFTQGLCNDGKRIFESDGMYGKGKVRQIQLDTGKSIRERPNAHREFAEGLEVIGIGKDRVLLQLTWREHIMKEYDVDTLQVLRTIPQPWKGEGWGVAYDKIRDQVYFVDGSATIHTYKRVHKDNTIQYLEAAPPRTATDDRLLSGLKIDGLNELEMVNGELWANIYPMRHHKASNCVVRLDPTTAKVLGWLDLNHLFTLQSKRVQSRPLDYVLNGITYIDNATDPKKRPRTLFTGKKWDFMYDVDIVPIEKHDGVTEEDHVLRHCGLFIPAYKQQHSLPQNSHSHFPHRTQHLHTPS